MKPEISDFTWESPGDGIRVKEIVIEAKLIPITTERTRVNGYFGEIIDELHIKKTFKDDGNFSTKLIKEVTVHEELRIDLNKCTVEELKNLADKFTIEVPRASKKGEIINKINECNKLQAKVTGEIDFPIQLIDLLPRLECFSSSNNLNPEEIINSVLKILCKNEISSGKHFGQIQEIELGIKQVLSSKIDELTPHIKKYYNEVEGVNIEPEFNISSGLGFVPLRLYKAGGGPIELQKKGDGKKRQVALAIYEWSTEALRMQESKDNLILIMDEPDTHMDYLSQRKLFDIITSYVQSDIQVIICTHSLNLLNRMPVNKINHFRLNEDGYTYIESLHLNDEETETMFINEIGLSIGLDAGTMFHERCFLIVEGPTEMHALPQFFKLIYNKSLNSAGIKLINGENNIGVRNFAKFLNLNNRKVVFLLDSDCKTGSTKRNFTQEQLVRDGFDLDKQVVFIGLNEFEDSFSDEIYRDLGNRWYVRDDSTWELSTFSAFRGEGKFSEQLQAIFRDSKPQIGYKLGKLINSIEHIPKDILTIFKKADSLAN